MDEKEKVAGAAAKEKPQKRPYVKPQTEIIELEPAEKVNTYYTSTNTVHGPSGCTKTIYYYASYKGETWPPQNRIAGGGNPFITDVELLHVEHTSC